MDEEQRARLNDIEDSIRFLAFEVKLLNEKLDRELEQKDDYEDFAKRAWTIIKQEQQCSTT